MNHLPSKSKSHVPDLLHAFFTKAVARWPKLIAVDVPPSIQGLERRQATYMELDRQSDAVADILHPLVTPECVVAILLPRDSERLYAAQIGVLKAGAAYACIDPAFPDGQASDILQDSEALALLTDASGLARVLAAGWKGFKAYDVAAVIAANPEPLPCPQPPWLGPENLAYLIYTSGTTGRPKGVEITHRGIANLVASDLAEFCLGPGDRVAQGSSSAYDSSVEENWLALAAGATLVVMDDDAVRLGPDLVPWLRRERITVLCPPPTLLRTTGCHDPHRELPDLKLLYVGGEALPRDVADAWALGLRLENGYGPTECTVTCLRTRILPGEPITIGRPVPGMNAWVLDEHLDEVHEGLRGELCLGGVGLARGYRKRPDVTTQKFPEHPRLGRIYRTGDLVHREADGRFVYHGRMDAQVKLRGYRIELEAIEARLAECPGVREAACTVQGEEPRRSLAAFVVAEKAQAPPKDDELKSFLAEVLPAYMVPSTITFLDALPKNVSGKLDRAKLPIVVDLLAATTGTHPPEGPLEMAIAAAFQKVLPECSGLSALDDFFTDLAGDSLSAALVVSLLRRHPCTAAITVRDLYEARTVQALALRASIPEPASAEPSRLPASDAGRPALVTCLQALWLLLELFIAAPVAYVLTFQVLPWLTHGLGLVPFLLLSPLLLMAGTALYAVITILLAVAVKRLLIGRYRPTRAPAWSAFHLRHWLVVQVTRLIPWGMLEGTQLQISVLRALGARIGVRVHIHRGVNLAQGGWDLLDISDDAALGLDSAVRLVDVDEGHIVVGPVSLGPGSALEVRAGVGPHTSLGAEAILGPLSSLPPGKNIPEGQRWEGVPASFTAYVPPPPPLTIPAQELSPRTYDTALLASRMLLGLLIMLPGEGLIIGTAHFSGVDADRALAVLYGWGFDWRGAMLAASLVLISGPLTVAALALACRAMGHVREGVIPRWSLAYLRVWLKSGLVNSASEWLSGTLFWPVWLRVAGMKLGQGCEISSILDVIPELVAIGPETFFADGIYLGGPRMGRGRVFLGAVSLGTNTFLGNHVVIPAGEKLPDDVLVGVSTVAQDPRIQSGTSWFGHPPFELPRREIVECDRAFTHEPSFIRYWNRVFWEALRFTLPLLPVLLFALWARALTLAEASNSRSYFLFMAVPLAGLAASLAFPLLVLALKWLLLGRVKPGVHPLWSCWCSRWDFLYVVWAMFARAPLNALDGTLLLNAYLRAAGMSIGKRVLLGPGSAQVVDPDMLSFGDDATVSALFQAHTFEDRVLKIDRVEIRAGATVGPGTVLLYGADIGEGTHVAPHSVVMKRENLLPGRRYEGCPTRPV
jgi:non-ribosomal peptide synthetase-like protein